MIKTIEWIRVADLCQITKILNQPVFGPWVLRIMWIEWTVWSTLIKRLNIISSKILKSVIFRVSLFSFFPTFSTLKILFCHFFDPRFLIHDPEKCGSTKHPLFERKLSQLWSRLIWITGSRLWSLHWFSGSTLHFSGSTLHFSGSTLHFSGAIIRSIIEQVFYDCSQHQIDGEWFTHSNIIEIELSKRL